MKEPNHHDFRRACGQFGTGVIIITTRTAGIDHGMTANAFMSISLTPPLIAVSIAEGAKMLPKIQEARRFAVSVLAHDTATTAQHFAGKVQDVRVDPFDHEDGLAIVKGIISRHRGAITIDSVVGEGSTFTAYLPIYES